MVATRSQTSKIHHQDKSHPLENNEHKDRDAMTYEDPNTLKSNQEGKGGVAPPNPPLFTKIFPKEETSKEEENITP